MSNEADNNNLTWTFGENAHQFINAILALIQGIYFKEFIKPYSEQSIWSFPYVNINIRTQWHPKISNSFCTIDPSVIPNNLDTIKDIAELNEILYCHTIKFFFDPYANRSKNFKRIIDLHMTYPGPEYELNFPKEFFTLENNRAGTIISAFDTKNRICLRFLIRDVISFYNKLAEDLTDPTVRTPKRTILNIFYLMDREYITQFLPLIEDAAEIETTDEDIEYIFKTYYFKLVSVSEYFTEILL